jgi:hypothetical protein
VKGVNSTVWTFMIAVIMGNTTGGYERREETLCWTVELCK